VPFEPPAWLLNRLAVRAFNAVYYALPASSEHPKQLSYDQFFFPLDRVHNWNRLYGARGFVQYQCVLPSGVARDATREVFSTVHRSSERPFLFVLKDFGDVVSPGLLSFPIAGTTLAMDFPVRSAGTLELLDRLDTIVGAANGRVYPAKDARMSGDAFRAFFPAWEQLAAHRDPKFSSSFWRRVTRGAGV
jgi:FAD/FMN-containing dehydrogenase